LNAKVTAIEDLRRDAWKRLNEIRFVMLTSRTDGSALASRPLTLQQSEFDSTLWFFVSRGAEFVAELANAPLVNVSCMDSKDNFYLSISGRATLVDDPDKARSLWSVMNEAWFPKGPTDPDLALLRIDVERAELWQSDTNRMVQLLRIAAAAALGTRPKGVGEHAVIKT
jgi:general stress protein 26